MSAVALAVVLAAAVVAATVVVVCTSVTYLSVSHSSVKSVRLYFLEYVLCSTAARTQSNQCSVLYLSVPALDIAVNTDRRVQQRGACIHMYCELVFAARLRPISNVDNRTKHQ
jgi:hypothetical protein